MFGFISIHRDYVSYRSQVLTGSTPIRTADDADVAVRETQRAMRVRGVRQVQVTDYRRPRDAWGKDALLSLLGERCPIIELPDGRRGVLQSIQREDGSGRSFNVTASVGGEVVTFYVKTAD